MRLSNGKFVAYNVNHNFLDVLNSEKAWFLGLMASDGNIKNDRIFSISQSGKQGEKILKYLIDILKFDGKMYINKNARCIQITSIKLVREMAIYGIIPRKTLVLDFPTSIHASLHKDFIRGYFDGDGSIGVYSNKNGSVYLCASIVGTKNFIDHLFKNIPIKANRTIIRKCKNLQELRWNGKKAISFCLWLFDNDNIYKSYKYEIFNAYMKKRSDKDTKYKFKKETVRRMLNDGHTPMNISKLTKIPFQTIYKWRNSNVF